LAAPGPDRNSPFYDGRHNRGPAHPEVGRFADLGRLQRRGGPSENQVSGIDGIAQHGADRGPGPGRISQAGNAFLCQPPCDFSAGEVFLDEPGEDPPDRFNLVGRPLDKHGAVTGQQFAFSVLQYALRGGRPGPGPSSSARRALARIDETPSQPGPAWPETTSGTGHGCPPRRWTA